MRKWRDRAACTNLTLDEAEVFFSDTAADQAKAKRMCQGCQVRAECLDFAVQVRDGHGVWGGMTWNERRTAYGLFPMSEETEALVTRLRELLASGTTFAEAGRALGKSASWVTVWAKRIQAGEKLLAASAA